MLFNSYIFILCFLPITVTVYYILNHSEHYQAGKAWLLAMSFWFYGYFNISYAVLLCISILLNYVLIHFMMQKETGIQRHILFATALLTDIGILFYYKYFDFFIENINAVCNRDFPLKNLLLPLGISFFTFQQLSLVIDYYKGKAPAYSLLDYAAYVTFFPQLIAGPIVLHSELIPQLCDTARKKINYDNIAKGLYGFSLGLAKKVLIADTFSKIVTVGYTDITALDTTNALITILCYTFQVYFDFSGYCDMALGLGCMFNMELPVNFNSPYKAASIAEFWNRWHMTLTRFFTQYVYIPLGGNRKGKLRTYLNTLIVFFISGLWHGADWTFILWGTIYGALLVLNKMCDKALEKVPRFLRWCVTFAIVNLLWIYFRADTIADAHLLLRQLFTGGFGNVQSTFIEAFGELTEVRALYKFGFASLFEAYPFVPLLAFMAVILAAVVWMRNTQEKMRDFVPNGRKLIVTTVLVCWCVLSLAGVSEFLYFNF